ncbi:hypothetical protein R1flu_015340 [Riccia fluitans]|uniref:Uncharacterized protein n=1 Tax=Riccia fluitans TaxID=41844 RepID=A0ABD1YLU7_9MARC
MVAIASGLCCALLPVRVLLTTLIHLKWLQTIEEPEVLIYRPATRPNTNVPTASDFNFSQTSSSIPRKQRGRRDPGAAPSMELNDSGKTGSVSLMKEPPLTASMQPSGAKDEEDLISIIWQRLPHELLEYVMEEVDRNELMDEWIVDPFMDESNTHFKTLIKYSIAEDSWSMATQQLPCDATCGFHLISSHKRPVMVNFGNSTESILFPPEFSSLDPNLAKFDAEDLARLLGPVGVTSGIVSVKVRRVVAESGTWFLLSHDWDSGSEEVMCWKLEASLGNNDIPPAVTQLPGLPLRYLPLVCTFAATLKAFV